MKCPMCGSSNTKKLPKEFEGELEKYSCLDCGYKFVGKGEGFVSFSL